MKNILFTVVLLTSVSLFAESEDTTWNPVNPVNIAYFGIDTLPFPHLPSCSTEIKFDPSINEENKSATLDCHGLKREIFVNKEHAFMWSTIDYPMPEIEGITHNFEITIFDENDNLVTSMNIEPAPGKCLTKDNSGTQLVGFCDQTGIIKFAPLSFRFGRLIYEK